MLTKKIRFHGHGGLRYVYKNGSAVRSRYVTVKYSKNPYRKHARYAVVVSKKVHKSAVGRNRIRRRIYEYLRMHHDKLPSPHDVVVIVSSSELIDMPAEKLQRQLDDVFAQTGLYGHSEK